MIFRFGLALLGATAFIALPTCDSGDLSFDKEKWASGKGNLTAENPRGKMVSDAEEAGVKVGATRASIRALLGEPDGKGPRGDSWALGFANYSMDPQNFVVDYNESDIATEVHIRE
jgi:hypothetical protein